jgi:AGZA family xanthine/uracil permease-like MFS transporter
MTDAVHRWLERRFALAAHRTNVRTEVVAGIATFMTMSYIIFVNPMILRDAGVPFEPAIAATALCAAIVTLLMGLLSNYPLAAAAGMGLNAALVYGLVKTAGASWQAAMGVVFIEGVLITLFVLTNIRQAVFEAIPPGLKRAIGVGIGLFIATIGFSGGRIIVAHPATHIAINPDLMRDPVAVLAMAGLALIGFMVVRRVKGGILFGILALTLAAVLADAFLGTRILSPGALENARRLVAMPRFDTVLQLDIPAALQLGMWVWIFAFLITDFFDTMGTVVAVGSEAGFLTPDGKLPRLKPVLLADSLGAVLGGLFGVSSNTTYIESAAGVAEGGRTGLTAVVVSLGFLLAMFFAPVIALVPAAATAPALIIVGALMVQTLREFQFDRMEELIPGFVTMIAIPLTYNIAYGIGFGFILYTLIQALTGRAREVKPLMWLVSAIFLLSFFLPKA